MTIRTTAAGLLAAALLGALLAPQTARAADKKNPAATPSPRLNKEGKPDAGWMKRHEGFVDIAKKGGVGVLFLGDSITDAWRGKAAKETWDKDFVPLHAANFGIGGDRTQHVLWRIENGELEGIKPKVAVVMIGTNNANSDSAANIAAGVKAIVEALHAKSPETKILLLGVFPRGATPEDKLRMKNADVNKIISKLNGKDNVRYLDIGSKFLQPDGKLTREIMPDLLHVSQRGYEIWGEAITPTVREMAGAKQ